MAQQKAWKKALIITGLLFFSAILWCILNGSNINSLMADDNVHQWEPMIETLFDRFFSGDGLSFYDFYSHKGLEIFSSGYYGQLNPFMYFSYAVSRYVFSFDIKVLVIYMICMYCLGNMMLYLALSELGISEPLKLLSVPVYSGTLFFFSWGFYYFTFNSYFFIPFFVYIMLKCRDRSAEWFVPGIILAFSLLMGHIQYSSYYVMLYCVIQCVTSVRKKSIRPLLQLLSGIGIFAVLNAPLFLSMLSGASNRSGSGINPASFLSDPVSPLSLFQPFHFLHEPDQINNRPALLENTGLGIIPFICLLILTGKDTKARLGAAFDHADKSFLRYDDEKKELRMKFLFLLTLLALLGSVLLFDLLFLEDLSGILLLFLIPLLISTALFLLLLLLDRKLLPGRIINRKNLRLLCLSVFLAAFALMMIFSVFTFLLVMIAYYCYLSFGKKQDPAGEDKDTAAVHALCFAALFFIVFGGGKKQVLALLFFRIPFLNQFRYLYKCAYIYIPLLIIICAFELQRLKNRNRKILTRSLCAVMLLCAAIGFSNIFYLINSGEHCYINNRHFYDYFEPDSDAAEVERLLTELGIDRDYRFLTCYSEDPAVEWSSAVCTYALTKNMNVPHSVFTLSGYDPLFMKKSYEQSDTIICDILMEYHMSNMAGPEFLKNLQETGREELSDRIREQLVRNGVRYILCSEQNPGYAEALKSFADRYPDLNVVRDVPWTKGFRLLELDGVLPVCHDAGGKQLKMDTALDSISFDTSFSDAETVTIAVTYNDKLVIELSDENGKSFRITPGCDPDGYVTADIPAGRFRVRLAYENGRMKAAVLCSAFTLLLTVLSLFIVCRRGSSQIKPAIT
ncbi:MAG: hypothetical protein K5697_16430 [Lachnospiraceae bacterium]|nr:hypothetical protein [Lachnospiraceae bacterium]